MNMIRVKARGNWNRTDRLLERALELVKFGELNRYGRMGVEALASATPVNTGETARSWSYTISRDPGVAKITWHNSNVNDGVNIAIILQYGHGTRNGGYVEGIDYINPAIRPVFDKIANDAWEEVTGK